MIRVKKNFEIDIPRLLSKMNDGFSLKTFQVLHNGNVAMVFECPLDETSYRYIIKIHNRFGIQRQCSFTAVEHRLLKIGLWSTELYAVLSSLEDEKKLTFMRVEPDMRDDLLELPDGIFSDIIVYTKESILASYEDGRVIFYDKLKPQLHKTTPGAVAISMDHNSRYMWIDCYDQKLVRLQDKGMEETPVLSESIETFLITRDGRTIIAFEHGEIVAYTKEDGTFRKGEKAMDVKAEACVMARDNICCYGEDKITMYKMY